MKIKKKGGEGRREGLIEKKKKKKGTHPGDVFLAAALKGRAVFGDVLHCITFILGWLGEKENQRLKQHDSWPSSVGGL